MFGATLLMDLKLSILILLVTCFRVHSFGCFGSEQAVENAMYLSLEELADSENFDIDCIERSTYGELLHVDLVTFVSCAFARHILQVNPALRDAPLHEWLELVDNQRDQHNLNLAILSDIVSNTIHEELCPILERGIITSHYCKALNLVSLFPHDRVDIVLPQVSLFESLVNAPNLYCLCTRPLDCQYKSIQQLPPLAEAVLAEQQQELPLAHAEIYA